MIRIYHAKSTMCNIFSAYLLNQNEAQWWTCISMGSAPATSHHGELEEHHVSIAGEDEYDLDIAILVEGPVWVAHRDVPFESRAPEIEDRLSRGLDREVESLRVV